MSTIIIEKGNHKVEFGVSSIPNRKSRALIKTRGAMVEVLAYFTSDQNADEFEKIIDFLIDTFSNGKQK